MGHGIGPERGIDNMLNQDEIYSRLYDYSGGLDHISSTHSHFIVPEPGTAISLHQLLQMTYISWIYPYFPDKEADRIKYIETMGTNTYFIWMAKSLGILYGDGKSLSADNWDRIDANFRRENSIPGDSLRILKDVCRYKAIILDKYDHPGSDLGLSELMTPTFRCDPFLHGYTIDGHDSNNNYPFRMLGLDRMPASIDEYISLVSEKISEMKAKGCVALKIAIAYERDLRFENRDISKARIAYGTECPKDDEIKNFGDYVMFELCRIAAELNIPVQIHTGLGKLEKSNAIHLKKLIEYNPATRFSLFHCGYPWMDDILGLLHNYRNVYPDLCWLPLISTSAAIRFIREALEVGDTGRFTWGCDTWTAQESYGALLAVRHCLAKALSEMCCEKLITVDQAETVIQAILCTNAEKIYNLDRI